MQTTLSCPQCRKFLRLSSEHAGKLIRCPGCTHVFRVPATEGELPAAIPESEPDSPADNLPQTAGGSIQAEPLPPETTAAAAQPLATLEAVEPATDRRDPSPSARPLRKPRPHARDTDTAALTSLPAANLPAWGLTRLALKLIHWGIVVNVLAPLLVAFVSVIFALVLAEASRDTRELLFLPMIAIWIVVGLVSVAAFFAIQVGFAACCCVPIESRAKLLAIAMLVVNAQILPVMFLVRVVETGFRNDHDFGEEMFLLPVTSAIGMVLGMATTVLFVLFLRQVAVYLNHRGLVASIRNYLVFYGSLVGVFLLLLLLTLVNSTSRSSSSGTHTTTSSSSGGRWEREEEERWRREQDNRQYGRHEHDSNRNTWIETYGLALAITLVAVVLFVAAVNVLWMLDLIRRTGAAIARAETASTLLPAAPA